MQRYGRPESRSPFPSASSVSNKTITRVSTRQTRIAQALGVICLHEAAKALLTQQTQARAQAIAHKLKDKAKPMQSALQNRWRIAARCGFALLLFQLCGCAAHLATVKTEPARLP